MSSDFIRGALLGLLVLIGFLLWNTWQKEHPEVAQAPTVQVSRNDLPTASTSAAANNAAQSSANLPGTLATSSATGTAKTQLIHVKTDVYDINIDPVGGAIVDAALPQYPQSLQDKSPYTLMNSAANKLYLAQSGLLSVDGPDRDQPGVYQSPKNNYQLADNQQQLVVPLTWQSPNGVEVTKTYTFTKGSYLMNVDYRISNHGSQPWKGNFFTQFKRIQPEKKSGGLFHINPYMGGVVSSPAEPYNKISFDDMRKGNFVQDIKGGWAAMEEHYFLSAWVPNPNETYQYSTRVVDGNTYLLSAVGSTMTVAPGQSVTVGAKLYSGPAIASVLKQIAPSLDKTVDYGYLWFIAIAIFWLMEHIYQFVGNWGWSIVLVTILIKGVFYKLSATSFRSMAAMRKLQPKLQQIKERYGDDRQRVGQETMALYKKEGVNPMGGCLPLVVQIPVFLALYWVLVESVQLRLAPFILWIHDLAAPDPFYVLPILMGLTMFIQQKLSPPPPDPMQAKMMMALPLVFTVFFLNFPAGLVLYWVVNNSLSILQQWLITRHVEKVEAEKKSKRR